ncbi:right-handed parallel beta-helix repeat-containing protein [Methylobacterium sp. J-068]|uniref:right-handed parallel beta-helix repeat-containing protein n=1 Tax=Methylobacterium sp. J-068 TaxID=2836649 RepID=UPI001FBAD070|nr:right-handed parallel beta-helix repeat-containing protein [Methylobacterium sp. J-068]MCJ2033484.1 right-handed parallel beta-helix repeat-containing protein [Methylobacterium sp. J-068]
MPPPIAQRSGSSGATSIDGNGSRRPRGRSIPGLAILGLVGAMPLLGAGPSTVGAATSRSPVHIRVDPNVPARSGASLVVPTLDAAIALLRRLHGSRVGDEPAVIDLAGGIHRLAEPVRIDAALGGRPDAPLILRGAPDGSTRLVGSVPLTRVDTPPPPGAAAGQRQRIVGYRLPAAAANQPSIGVHRIHPVPSPPLGLELFDEQGALTPARWPNAGWAKVEMPPARAGSKSGSNAGSDPILLVPRERAESWLAEPDLWVAGYLGQDWSYETLPALAMLPGSGRLALVGQPHYPLRDGDRFFVENALSELDAPGEWWRDAPRGLVFVIPRTGADALEVSVAPSLIAIEGARHVRLEGLTFERTRGDAVIVTGGDDVVLEDCTIRWTGARGLVITGASRSGLRRSVVAETGEDGVVLDGGDRQRLIPSGNFVEDSVIVRFGRLGRTYKGAVDIDGVGMRVIGNLIAHAPHLAMRFQGNDHEIAFNEIFDVVNETSDASAIYTGRDIAAQGTRLTGNFLHDIKPRMGFEVKGIYLDDMASGIKITGNLFLRVQQPLFVGGGRDNEATDNAFVASSPAFFLDGRGEVWAGPPITSSENNVRAAFDQVPATRPPWSVRYPRLAGLLGDEPLAAKRNVFRDNLLIDSEGPRIAEGADPARQTVTGNRRVADAEAARASAASILQTMPARSDRAGFVPLPVDRMDRVSVLSRIPALKRRAGTLLSRDGSP